MKIKLKELLAAKELITKLGTSNIFPMKLCYRLFRLVKDVNRELETFEEARANTVKKYGEEDTSGSVRVMPKNLGIFTIEMRSLLEEEVEVFNLDLSLNELEEIIKIAQDKKELNNNFLTAIDLLNLETFLSNKE